MASFGAAADALADTATAAIIIESCLICMNRLLEVRYCIVFASKTCRGERRPARKAADVEALLSARSHATVSRFFPRLVVSISPGLSRHADCRVCTTAVIWLAGPCRRCFFVLPDLVAPSQKPAGCRRSVTRHSAVPLYKASHCLHGGRRAALYYATAVICMANTFLLAHLYQIDINQFRPSTIFGPMGSC